MPSVSYRNGFFIVSSIFSNIEVGGEREQGLERLFWLISYQNVLGHALIYSVPSFYDFSVALVNHSHTFHQQNTNL